MNRRRLALGIGTLLVLVALLAIYAVLHSPLRKPIWEALFNECDMFCRPLRLGTEVVDALAGIWFMGVVLFGAAALAQRLVSTALERIAAFGLLAYALFVIPAAIVAYGGDLLDIRLLRPPGGPLLASLPAVVAVAWSWRTGWRPSWPRGTLPFRLTPALVLLIGVITAGAILQVGFAVRYPPSGFDDLGYHGPLAVLLWHDGSLSSFLDRFGGTPVLSHPGGAELWQGLLLQIGGEPLALGGQIPFGLLGASGVALFARRLGLRQGAALLAALFYLSAPMVLEQMAHIRNDVIGAALVVVSAAFLAGGARETLPVRLILGILGMGLMLVTKLALLPAVAALALVVLWILVRERRAGGEMGPVWRAVGVGVVVAGLAVAPWWLRNLLRDGNPFFPLDFPIIGGGIPWRSPTEDHYIPNGLLWPLYPWLEQYGVADGLGGAYAVGIIPGLIAAAFLARRKALAVLALLVVVSIPAWYLLDKREPRFILGVMATSFAVIPFVLVGLRRRWRNAAVAVLTAAVCVTVGAGVITQSPDQTVERIGFYDQAWGIDPIANALPESEGILLDDRCGSGVSRLYPWFGGGQQRTVARVDCDGTTAQQILKLMKREGLSYVELVIPLQDRAARALLYPPESFTLVSESTRQTDKVTLDRVLYRWNDAPPPKVKPSPLSAPPT